ncbi:MAG TPA: hypothetical protein VEC12_01515 [Bacteroidia bacterium]|nr:hypothetical protein [Bacteroidia bacterium]
MRKAVILLLAVSVFLSCNKEEKELLRITSSRKITDGNAIQNLIYTQDYQLLKSSDELGRYLSGDELQQAANSTTRQYYFYKDVISTADFKVIVLLAKEFYNSDSAYYYQLRTYAPDGKPIDKIDFAIWDEQKNMYCSGILKTPGAVLSESLKIIKTCGERIDVYQISNGRFIISSASDDGINWLTYEVPNSNSWFAAVCRMF